MSKHFTYIKQSKNNKGIAFQNDEQIKKIWEEYFSHLLNKKNERLVFEDGGHDQGLTTGVSREEVIFSVQEMQREMHLAPIKLLLRCKSTLMKQECVYSKI